MANGDFIFAPEDLLHENVPLPGSVAGRRIIKLEIPAQDFRQDVPLGELFTALGFVKSTGTWRYDRARALEWLLGELRGLQYSWVQDPWRMQDSQGSRESDAGPRPTRPMRDVDRPKLPARKVLEP